MFVFGEKTASTPPGYPGKENLWVAAFWLIGKEKTCIDIRHYLHTLEKKPGALKNSLALKSNPELKKLFDTYYKDKPKTFIDLLRKNKELSTDEIIRNLTPKNQQVQIQERVDEKAESQINELMKLFTGGQRVYH